MDSKNDIIMLISDSVEEGVINQMGRILFWMKRKRRIRDRKCGRCCLLCAFYNKCSKDGKF